MTAAEPSSPHAISAQRVSSRNRQIVEGALLGDIAVVLLLGRVYLPIPGVRTIWRLLAGAPFVLLAERQGIRVLIMSGIVSYLLLTALVGPTLALTALDTAFAAFLLAIADLWRWPRWLVVPVMGLVYAVSDIVVPTILFAFLFRVSLSTLAGTATNAGRNGIRVLSGMLRAFNHGLAAILGHSGPRIPVGMIQTLGYDVVAGVAAHWVITALVAAVILGVANVVGYAAAAEVVLARLPASTRSRQALS